MIFKSNETSEALIKATKPWIHGGRLLDLGCGSGVINLALQDLASVYASDISEEAISYLKNQNFPIIVKCGNLFEPWQGKRFDYIIDDVSGISEDIAKISPWYDSVPCATGKDGTDLIIKVLQRAPEYLTTNGKLFFPIVSFSNVDKILEVARDNFDIELLSHNLFPLPKGMYEHIDLLRELKSQGIQFEEKFGMIIWYSDIYLGMRK